MNNIVLKELNFSYKNKQVLNNISANFEENEISVILGLNGCGKTTILKLITGLLKIKENTISLNELNINEIKNHQLSKLVSYVPQLINNNNTFLVQDFLMFSFANRLKFYSQPSKEQLGIVKGIAKEFLIEDLLDQSIAHLSGGQKQMVYICSAIIQDTPIIVLDEPLSALDLKNQYKIIEILKKLKDKGKTIILSCHNPNICLHLDAKVFLIKEGKLINQGPARKIITPVILKEIYGNNLKYSKESDYDEITFR
ncbi:ABC transporter ATP-binding protein [Spiroplasma culicicola]|uniref:Iron compounds ABC transporter ATP-binding protein n=1 Tax=Spiroplasma culicicola AES-1 TaxID=1276246 RepID=W6AGG7_9MOLU|nr:ABC transporter ATP-binding protein [Spiroplasma culicicola]AHI52769.1 iron compounds ABC transporter ATP-binding protein [Spiroplasma culicicola AES-1]